MIHIFQLRYNFFYDAFIFLQDKCIWKYMKKDAEMQSMRPQIRTLKKKIISFTFTSKIECMLGLISDPFCIF